MKAAVVESISQSPRYGEFEEPRAGDNEVLVKVRAAALSNLVKAQASGKHYSSAGQARFVPGYDGVGTLSDGRRVYFFGPRAPFGAMAEWSIAASTRLIPLPDALDDVTAAALGNPGLASWGALLGRAQFEPGECVLVNGATGVAGQQAVQVAKYLDACKVIATGRDESALAKLRNLGADQTISLLQSGEELVKAFRGVMHGVDVVLDYLWGASAQAILEASKGSGSPEGEPRIRYVQIGSISGDPIALKAEWLRSSGVEMLGSGLGSLGADAIVGALRRMFDAAAAGAGLKIDIEAVPLTEVGAFWDRIESGRRIVFTL